MWPLLDSISVKLCTEKRLQYVLIVRQIVQGAQNQGLEHDYLVPGFASSGRLAFPLGLPPHLPEAGAEQFPRDNRVEFDQRVFLVIQLHVPALFSEIQLFHFPASGFTLSTPSACNLTGGGYVDILFYCRV